MASQMGSVIMWVSIVNGHRSIVNGLGLVIQTDCVVFPGNSGSHAMVYFPFHASLAARGESRVESHARDLRHRLDRRALHPGPRRLQPEGRDFRHGLLNGFFCLED